MTPPRLGSKTDVEFLKCKDCVCLLAVCDGVLRTKIVLPSNTMRTVATYCNVTLN